MTYDLQALLGQLTENDIQWIFDSGDERNAIANTAIIKEGEIPNEIYIVLEGLLGIYIETQSEAISRLGPGEILGEISFLQNQPATATVQTIENSQLLVITREALKQKCDSDIDFAFRFYRSLAVMISGRLKESNRVLRKAIQERPLVADAVSRGWDEVIDKIQQFKTEIKSADAEALKNDGQLPDEVSQKIQKDFRAFTEYLNQKIGDDSEEHPSVRDALGQRFKEEVLPYLLLTDCAERFYSKPRGYAGDFYSIEMIYRDVESGKGRIGPLMDRCFLNEPAAQAVRNRRPLLKNEIISKIEAQSGDGPCHVTSLASGPAAEIFDTYDALDDASLLKPTLIDIDYQALAFVSDKASKKHLLQRLRLENGNLLYLSMGRQKLEMPLQDLVYSIGLIDYFNDKFVIKLLNYIHKILKPGGKVILGNFHPKNTTKALMDHALDWRLIHRSEEDMNRLYSESSFGRNSTRIVFEDAGINLFAECIKE